MTPRIRHLEFCADHLCTVALQSVKSDNFEWATMEPDVLTNVKLVYKHLLQDTQNNSELFYFPACFFILSTILSILSVFPYYTTGVGQRIFVQDKRGLCVSSMRIVFFFYLFQASINNLCKILILE